MSTACNQKAKNAWNKASKYIYLTVVLHCLVTLWCIILPVRLTKKLIVRECCLTHNHRVGMEILAHYPFSRKLNLSKEQEVLEILKPVILLLFQTSMHADQPQAFQTSHPPAQSSHPLAQSSHPPAHSFLANHPPIGFTFTEDVKTKSSSDIPTKVGSLRLHQNSCIFLD